MDIEDPVLFFRNHAETAKQYFAMDVDRFMVTIHVGLDAMSTRASELLASVGGEEQVINGQVLHHTCMAHLVRYGIIHLFTMLDEYAFMSLDVYGRIMHQETNHTNDEGGAVKVLPAYLTTDAKRSLAPDLGSLNFFRDLRNSFAHDSYKDTGRFRLSALSDNFESRLKKQKGFKLSPSQHAFVDGKPGYVIQYAITGIEPLHELAQLCHRFYAGVLCDFESSMVARWSVQDGTMD